MGVGVGAAGLGALLRTIKEVPTVLGGKPSQATMTGIPGPVEVPIPLDPNQEQQLPSLPKVAAVKDMYQGMAEMAYNNVLKPMGLDKADTWQTTNPMSKWWQSPATIGTGLAAGAGGWKLVDWLADRRRQNAGDSDLTAARQEYENAVKGLHPKTAALNDARDAMQKQAAGGIDPLLRMPLAPSAVKNYAGLSTNAMAGIATALGIPTAMYAYNHTRENSDVKALQEALMARRRAQQIRNPAPPHLVLSPAA